MTFSELSLIRQESAEAKDGEVDKGDLGVVTRTGLGATYFAQTSDDLIFFFWALVAVLQMRGTLATTIR
jgi:hypothetical protein